MQGLYRCVTRVSPWDVVRGVGAGAQAGQGVHVDVGHQHGSDVLLRAGLDDVGGLLQGKRSRVGGVESDAASHQSWPVGIHQRAGACAAHVLGVGACSNAQQQQVAMGPGDSTSEHCKCAVMLVLKKLHAAPVLIATVDAAAWSHNSHAVATAEKSSCCWSGLIGHVCAFAAPTRASANTRAAKACILECARGRLEKYTERQVKLAQKQGKYPVC